MKKHGRKLRLAVCLTLSAMMLLAALPASAAMEQADIVLKNGVVYTMVKEGDSAQAVAIKGDTIIYVGDDKGAEAYIGEDTDVIDLKGKMVSPGFMDGHIHGPGMWLERLFAINLEGLSTNEEYLKAIEKFVKANPDMDAYTGGTFMLNAYQQADGSNPGPQKADLDKISADKPIVVNDTSYHSAWVNSKALEIAGITKDTPNPTGGIITKDEKGEPTGFLTDSAMNLVTDKIKAEYTDEMYLEAIEAFQEEANSLGITGITNIMGAASLPALDPALYTKLERDGDLALRMRLVNTVNPGTTPEQAVKETKGLAKLDSDMIKTGTVKLFYDGVTESGTAVMIEPYLAEAGQGDGWKGEPVWDEKEFDAMVAALDKEGIQVHTHAIGDGAVRETQNAYAAAKKANKTDGLRHTMTHVCAIAHDDIKINADLGIVNALQFLWMYGDPLYELEAAFIGEERAKAMYPVKDMIEAGCIVSGASDTPVTGYNVLEEIEVGVTRNSPYPKEEDTDMYRWPEQGLSAYQMLEIYTKNVAYQNFMEDMIGTVEVGKKADLVVLGEDILKIDPKKISDTEVVYTISNGDIVFGD